MAYNAATPTALFNNSDSHGGVIVVLTYTGNAGETPVVDPISVNAGSLAVVGTYLRGIAVRRLATLNNNLIFVADATPLLGTPLDVTTPLTPDPVPATYMAASDPFTPGTQDAFLISGSATRRVTVLRLSFTTVQTAAGTNAWRVVARTTANSGGSSSTLTAVPINGVFPAAGAVVRSYTANPTAGTLFGSLWSARVPSPAPASAPGLLEQNTTEVGLGRGIVLTGIAQSLALNFGGQAVPAGLSVIASVLWTED